MFSAADVLSLLLSGASAALLVPPLVAMSGAVWSPCWTFAPLVSGGALPGPDGCGVLTTGLITAAGVIVCEETAPTGATFSAGAEPLPDAAYAVPAPVPAKANSPAAAASSFGFFFIVSFSLAVELRLPRLH